MGKRKKSGKKKAEEAKATKAKPSAEQKPADFEMPPPSPEAASPAESAPQSNVDPQVKLVCEILKNPTGMAVEALLNQARIRVTPAFVEDVLKASYGAGAEALKFFRWAGWQMVGNFTKQSTYAWNLLVDLLGFNKLFDAMWDIVKGMKAEGILSVETFSSVFTSYVIADKVGEALLTFEVMEQYGCMPDTVAFNSLLCALCRYNQTSKAQEFFEKTKERIAPDADSYALILEGWEREGQVYKARHTFGEMIIRMGWKPSNTAAYTAFLNTLFNASQVDEAMKFLQVMRGRKCFPDPKFFRKALKILCHNKNTKDAFGIWEVMQESGYRPDLSTYNAMVGVFCQAEQIDSAYRLLDEMVFCGDFPDSRTYNIFFQGLIRARKVTEASSIFREMTKNECHPVYESYAMAIKMYFEVDDPEMATMMWRHMLLKGVVPKEDCASTMVNGFLDLGRLSEARKYLEETLGRGIQLSSEILGKFKITFIKAGKSDVVESLRKKFVDF